MNAEMGFTWTRRQVLGVAAGIGAAMAQVTPKTVRIGIIGVGGRGTGFLKASLAMGGVEVAALCDILPEAANRGVDLVQTGGGKKPALFTQGEKDYRGMTLMPYLSRLPPGCMVRWRLLRRVPRNGSSVKYLR
jgi:hypothetical protein